MSQETTLDKDTVEMIGPKGEVSFVSRKCADSPAVRAMGYMPKSNVIPEVPSGKRGPGRPRNTDNHAG